MKEREPSVRPWYWPKEGQPHRTEPFSWIVKGEIAASWWPDPYVFEIYKKEGIQVVVNCCEFDNREDVPPEFTYHHFNVPDYGVPSEEQIKKFLKIMNQHQEDGNSVVIHCVAGCGRTGQFILAWCAKAGHFTKGVDPVQWLRSKRQCCLETEEQIKFSKEMVKRYL